MQLRIRFTEKSSREQSLLVSELETVMAAHVAETNLVKEREDTQDPGTILAVILGAPAVVGAVSALGAWLLRKNQSGVTIEDENGTVIFKNMESKDVAAAIKAVQARVSQN